MVLDPSATPSLFYRFLGKTRAEGIGMDTHSFCKELGPEKGNQILREHWDTWYTDEHIKNLSDRGVEMIRLPIGDWTLDPYGPYINCTDGAADKIDWILDTCERYGIQVWLDMHAWKDS
jgi:glucan 1,3-beta-glucosidase